MELLKNRILTDGKAFDGGILKVDSFLNHQIDPVLMKSIGEEFVNRFSDLKIDKIITIEASGIAPALMLGSLLQIPVVFVKKAVPKTMENMLSSKVYSYTKSIFYDICMCADFIQPDDNVVFIDDFLALGNAAIGVKDLIDKSGANLLAMGFVIEKRFQEGVDKLQKLNVRVESLVSIIDMDNGHIVFA